MNSWPSIAYGRPSNGIPRKLIWRPDEKLRVLYRVILREQHGHALEEDWSDAQPGDELVSRDFFSDYLGTKWP